MVEAHGWPRMQRPTEEERELTKIAENPYSYEGSDLASYRDTIALSGRLQQIGLVAVLIVTGALIVNLEAAVGIRD